MKYLNGEVPLSNTIFLVDCSYFLFSFVNCNYCELIKFSSELALISNSSYIIKIKYSFFIYIRHLALNLASFLINSA